MKKKIKDLTIGEFISIARKSKDLQESRFDACDKCPLANVDDLECWNFCSKRQCLRERIDNILDQEIEAEEDE